MNRFPNKRPIDVDSCNESISLFAAATKLYLGMTKEEMAKQQTNGGGRLMYYRVQNVEHAGISEVCSGLFISGICALKPAIMQEYGITLIINATSEVCTIFCAVFLG